MEGKGSETLIFIFVGLFFLLLAIIGRDPHRSECESLCENSEFESVVQGRDKCYCPNDKGDLILKKVY